MVIINYLTKSKSFNIVRQSHGGKVSVSAISSKMQYWWHNKLMKMRSWWRPILLPWCDPFANNPCLFSKPINNSITFITKFMYTRSNFIKLNSNLQYLGMLSCLVFCHLNKVVLTVYRCFFLNFLESFC